MVVFGVLILLVGIILVHKERQKLVEKLNMIQNDGKS